ncbi:GNAT family N-acetyltransferase [Adonisia turfae]|uniref:N-acetyltransferase n=1 Tax=Adonisia turfae CCMR0081 TaxID=2292702 RepID=A0A6M0RRJ7_9CYAN|nr:GNAT family protein [Adonisia turfae]NEZ58423.1 N-acetyltransferase [Adonisia turfae CCMR0081]
MNRAIRELEANDIDQIIQYFLKADSKFLKGMGVEPTKLPSADEWKALLNKDLNRPISERHFYYILWELDNHAIGHSNINKITFGQEAYMHLHLWEPQTRQRNHGTYFIGQSISKYFQTFELKRLVCEPYAMNPAPNRTLAKVGFELVKTYETTPGWINFQQTVNRWILSEEKWSQSAAM